MECYKVIKVILSEGEVERLKALFEKLDKRGPKGDLVGIVDSQKGTCGDDCLFRYTWGYSYYCDNQEVLAKYTKEHSKG